MMALADAGDWGDCGVVMVAGGRRWWFGGQRGVVQLENKSVVF